MSLEKRAELANFLGSWFPDADLEGLSDGEIVVQFVRVASAAEVSVVREQLDALLTSGEFDLDEIGNEANRYFRSRAECEAWLQELHSGLAS